MLCGLNHECSFPCSLLNHNLLGLNREPQFSFDSALRSRQIAKFGGNFYHTFRVGSLSALDVLPPNQASSNWLPGGLALLDPRALK